MIQRLLTVITTLLVISSISFSSIYSTNFLVQYSTKESPLQIEFDGTKNVEELKLKIIEELRKIKRNYLVCSVCLYVEDDKGEQSVLNENKPLQEQVKPGQKINVWVRNEKSSAKGGIDTHIVVRLPDPKKTSINIPITSGDTIESLGTRLVQAINHDIDQTDKVYIMQHLSEYLKQPMKFYHSHDKTPLDMSTVLYVPNTSGRHKIRAYQEDPFYFTDDTYRVLSLGIPFDDPDDIEDIITHWAYADIALPCDAVPVFALLRKAIDRAFKAWHEPAKPNSQPRINSFIESYSEVQKYRELLKGKEIPLLDEYYPAQYKGHKGRIGFNLLLDELDGYNKQVKEWIKKSPENRQRVLARGIGLGYEQFELFIELINGALEDAHNKHDRAKIFTLKSLVLQYHYYQELDLLPRVEDFAGKGIALDSKLKGLIAHAQERLHEIAQSNRQSKVEDLQRHLSALNEEMQDSDDMVLKINLAEFEYAVEDGKKKTLSKNQMKALKKQFSSFRRRKQQLNKQKSRARLELVGDVVQEDVSLQPDETIQNPLKEPQIDQNKGPDQSVDTNNEPGQQIETPQTPISHSKEDGWSASHKGAFVLLGVTALAGAAQFARKFAKNKNQAVQISQAELQQLLIKLDELESLRGNVDQVDHAQMVEMVLSNYNSATRDYIKEEFIKHKQEIEFAVAPAA